LRSSWSPSTLLLHKFPDVAKKFSCVVGMADTCSHSIEQLVAGVWVHETQRTGQPMTQMLLHISQRTWRHICLCIQHQGTHTDPLDM
jgi:hypothetical protein